MVDSLWRDVAGAVLQERKRLGSIEPRYYLSFVSPDTNEVDTIPVTRGPATQAPLAWHIDITDATYTVSPSINSPGHYHSPNPAIFRRVGKLRDTVDNQEVPTTPAEQPPEEPKVLTGAETAVGDLLTQLRLTKGPNELSTVLGWLDSHGVLDAVDESANKPPAETPPPAESEAPQVAADATAGEATSTASETTAPAVAPTEPTASHAAAAEAATPVETAPATTEATGAPDANPPEPTAKDLVQLAVGALTKLAEKL